MGQVQWTIKSLLEWTTAYFIKKNIAQARLEAEVLLARVLEVDRVYLYVHYSQPVGKEERELYKTNIKRRLAGEPIAYITGVKEFMSLEFALDPEVLIPRPETELLVETALELVKLNESPLICEVGTGSGAIAVSLSHYCPRAQIWAGDISDAALSIASNNARRLEAKVDFRCGSLLEPFAMEQPFDLIVANLPYIPMEEYAVLPDEIRLFEPQLALLAPGDGLGLYRNLKPQAVELLKPDGYILWEIGAGQGDAARDMMEGFAHVEIIKDLAGRDRLLKARKGVL
ncbi:MAG: peptide chain release factor N(5)-glutamine methyltransferase [Syntrophomonadaceae bacterium]